MVDQISVLALFSAAERQVGDTHGSADCTIDDRYCLKLVDQPLRNIGRRDHRSTSLTFAAAPGASVSYFSV